MRILAVNRLSLGARKGGPRSLGVLDHLEVGFSATFSKQKSPQAASELGSSLCGTKSLQVYCNLSSNFDALLLEQLRKAGEEPFLLFFQRGFGVWAGEGAERRTGFFPFQALVGGAGKGGGGKGGGGAGRGLVSLLLTHPRCLLFSRSGLDWI